MKTSALVELTFCRGREMTNKQRKWVTCPVCQTVGGSAVEKAG